MKNAQEKILDPLSTKEEQLKVSKVISSTPSQMEIWLQCHLGGEKASLAYNESYSLKLFGDVNLELLEEAYQFLITNHEGMRAIFSLDGTQIHILESIKTSISYKDISDLSETEKNTYIEKFRIDTGFYEFDLQKGPLYILELIKLSDSEYRLTFTSHHIMFDGWSIVLFFSHLGLVYGQLVEGKEAFLPELQTLSDYTKKIEKFSEGEEYKSNLKFWLKRLSNPVPNFELPIDFERPPIRKLEADRVDFKASKELIIKVKQYGIKKKVSVYLILFSIYELFLSLWSKSSDIILGMPIAGQPRMGSLNLIGHSVFLLPVKSKVDFQLTFEDYLDERSKSFSEILEHGAISFGELIQNLKIKRDLSRTPLVPLICSNIIGVERRMKFGNLERKLLSNPKAFTNFEIILALFGTIDDLNYEWTYNTSLFSRETILEAAEKYDQLVQLIIETPSLKLSEIRHFLDGDEASPDLQTEQKLAREEPIEEEITIPYIIEKFQETASVLAEKTAVVTNNNSISYKELNIQSNQLAGFLKDKGVKPGDFIGIYLERSNATIISIMAILKAGAACLPIDVEIPRERVIYMLENSGAKFFFTDQPDFENGVLEEKRLVLDQILKSSLNFPPENNPVKTSLESPMYIIYTSGSTGNPKGVILTHKNLNYFSKVSIRDFNFSSDDQVAGVTSVSFDVATFELLIPYMFGSTVYMLDKYERKDPKQILSLLEAKGITKMFATPTHWQMMVNSGWSTPMTSLTAFSGGEPLKKSLVDQLSPLLKGIFNHYGPSETTVLCTVKKIDPSEAGVTIGKELSGTKIYIVDKSGNLITQPNISGELWIGGDGVGKSYLGLNELSQEKFIKNPFEEIPERLYKSGDLGYRLPNGEIQCEGRVDNQVKVRGHRIELGEIEEKILQSDEVANAVVGTDDSKGFLSLIGYVALKKELKDKLDLQEFEAKLRERLSIMLPEYMVPSDFCFVDDFKLTTTDKIDRKQLPKIKRRETGRTVDKDHKEDKTERFTEVERRVFRVWSSVLENSNFDLDTDFFLAGGHSLLGVKLISLLEKEFDLKLTLVTLFKYPTVKSFSLFIENEKKDLSLESLVLIKKGSPNKVVCFVHGVGLNPIEVNTLIENMDDDQTIYGLQSPAISGNAEPFKTIPEMAKHFIGELEKSEIKGPYNLIGNSIGGLIAFEMAKQLIEKNKKIGFLAMIDTIANYNFEKPKKLLPRIKRFINKLGFEFEFLSDDLNFYINYRKNYIKEKWFNYKQKTIINNDLSSRIRRIEIINVDAWKDYDIQPLDIDITLFIAQKRTFYVQDFETLGWSRYVRSIEKLIMPGEHANMLKPPHGSEFTRVLQEKLNLFMEN
ncbi:amino acid adenylation domain-containing protein [Algoriphagus sp. SE2]|uniref:amino acid adenylation domain-containing protein n=1 Tax=Algoriphagus sp. SE2 TaxID=3141536 RepID=UPI0031CD5D3D